MATPQKHFQRSPRPALPKNRLIIGRKPMVEALQQHATIEKIFLLKTASGEEVALIRKLAKEQNILVSYVPSEKLDRFSKANHQGVIGIAGLISYQPMQGVLDLIVDRGETPLLVIADGITDTRNLGAIARSALCFGAHALIVPMANSAAITEESIKTSAGALEQLPICRVPTIEQAVDTAKLNGLQIAATSLKTSNDLSNVDLSVPLALVMGSEDEGVGAYVLKAADHLVRIPMAENFDSLNVSVATGIMLYECHKQRTT